MAYNGVAEQQPGGSIYPFFHVHKVVNNAARGLALKRYGDDGGWFLG
jgi:hypothetical protein